MFILKIIVFIIIFIISLLIFPNKSNFSSKYIIPIIVALLVKYYLGDWDRGYNYTYKDIMFWMMCFIFSYLLVIFIN